MAQIEIKVRAEDYEGFAIRTVDAEIIGYFAVHPQYIRLFDGNEMSDPHGAYVVTHIPSGKAIRYGQSRVAALALASTLTDLTPRWADVTGESAKQTKKALGMDVYKKARAILELYPEHDEDEE